MLPWRPIIFFILLITAAPGAEPANDWQLTVQKKSITVYKREVAGSNLFEFRVQAQIKAPLLHILAVLQDLSAFVEWDPYYKELKILEKKNENEYVYYYAVKTPCVGCVWGFVARSKITVDEKNRVLRMHDTETVHASAPVRSDRVRMPLMRIQWYFKPVMQGQQTWIELTVHTDPAGVLPDWIKNMAGSDGAYEMIDNLRNRVESGKYDRAFAKKYSRFEKWH